MSNTVTNYVLPGLTSILMNTEDSGAKVRMFVNTRHQVHSITPHSHRFNLSCLVIKGWVENTIWVPCSSRMDEGDLFQRSTLEYCGKIGSYRRTEGVACHHRPNLLTHREGDLYHMAYDEIHSIVFSKGAKLLLIESAPECKSSVILEPIVDGKHLETMRVEDWMFKGDRG